MFSDVGQSDQPLFYFETVPPSLNTVSGSFMNDLVDRQLIFPLLLTVDGGSDCLLELGYGSDLLK
jgi:hypothetical protein